MNYASPDARRLFEQAAVAEYAYRLQQDGWETRLEEPLGSDRLRADLVAQRGNETVVFGFKRPSVDASWKEQVQALRAAAKAMGARFRMVFLPTQDGVSAEVSDLDELFFDALRDDPPSEFAALSNDTRIDEITDTAVERVSVTSDGIEIKGTGSVSVTLYSGEGDAIDMISVPITFEGTINDERKLELHYVHPDLTVWYGEAA